MESKDKITTMEDVPVIDLSQYMGQDANSDQVKDLCGQVANSLHQNGILIIKDPRVDEQDNDEYIDMMEKYFESRGAQLYSGQSLDDARAEHHYQVGVCPEQLEIARDHSERMRNYAPENKPMSPLIPVFDAKWRFMWKIGERPADAADNFPQVVPADFPNWEAKMDKWGNKLIEAVGVVSEMAALGMGLEKTSFSKNLDGGAHLLAPTGSDLEKNDVGAIFAGFHYDIAFLTIHGKSRYPGLYAWLRNGQKLQVKVPKGCLLLQAGKTFEHLTGGFVLAGLHEVIYTEQTKEAFEKAKAENRSIWRVSSTLFSHFRFNVDCSPMPELANLYDAEAAKEKYGKASAFDILMEELNATNMVQDDSELFTGTQGEADKLA